MLTLVVMMLANLENAAALNLCLPALEAAHRESSGVLDLYNQTDLRKSDPHWITA